MTPSSATTYTDGDMTASKNTEVDTPKLTILNAMEHTNWVLYLDSTGFAANGTTSGKKSTFNIPEGVKGPGKIKFTVPIRTREYQNEFFSVPVVVGDEHITIDVPKYMPVRRTSTVLSPTEEPPVTEPVKIQEEEKPEEEEPAPKKKQKKSLDETEQIPNNEDVHVESETKNESQDEKQSFWDRFK